MLPETVNLVSVLARPHHPLPTASDISKALDLDHYWATTTTEHLHPRTTFHPLPNQQRQTITSPTSARLGANLTGTHTLKSVPETWHRSTAQVPFSLARDSWPNFEQVIDRGLSQS